MVAMILVVASVVILALLQTQTTSFGNFSQGQTDSSECGLAELKYQRALDCSNPSSPGTSASSNIESDNSQCDWTANSPSSYC